MPAIRPETLSMRTRDGVRLDADVYRPTVPGDYPVLLMRQPYGRRIATTICFAHPAWYAEQGYIVVIQDVRGRGTSEGVFSLFEQETEDGIDTIAWAAALPGSTGAVGMYGFSYQGVVQLLAAAALPPALKAVAPAMIGWDLTQDWAYENGAFSLAANLSWAVQLAAQGARHSGDAAAFAELSEAARSLALGRENHARPDVLERYARHVPHHADWLDQPFNSAYWDRISPAAQVDTLVGSGPPALFISGWYDSHLPGTVAAYRAYERARGAEARLVIGPWAHFPWGRRLGGLDFGDAAISDLDRVQVGWFDRHLKGAPSPAPPAPVRLFDMGARSWRQFQAWPTTTRTWHLESDGRAALDERSGRLQCMPPSPALPVPVTDTTDHLVHDPWRPVLTTGGAFGTVAGPVDRTDTDARPDVLTYTSTPLDAALPLAGAIVVDLDLTADCPSFDVSCIVSRVDAQGRARHLTEGYLHMPDPAADGGTVRLALRPTCATLEPGERLRLSVAAASFPAYPINPGTGARPTGATVDTAQIITLRLSTARSRIELPVCPKGDAA